MLARLQRERDRNSWHKFTEDHLGEKVSTPIEFQTIGDSEISIDQIDFPPAQNNDLRQSTYGNTTILASGKQGLWKKVGNQAPVEFKPDGWYSHIVVSPDGHWAVALSRSEAGDRQMGLVRIDLQTGKFYKIGTASAEVVWPEIFIPSSGKVLLQRQSGSRESVNEKGESGLVQEFFLLDPATGTLQSIRGDFRPFLNYPGQFFQPTGRLDEYWVALSQSNSGQTEVGRYNAQNFKFERVMLVPKLSFDSTKLWVDEAEGKFYVVNSGDLISIPLPSSGRSGQ